MANLFEFSINEALDLEVEIDDNDDDDWLWVNKKLLYVGWE